EGKAFISANTHASVTGKIQKIEEVLDSSGYKRTAVIIKKVEPDQWADNIDTSEDLNKEIPDSAEEIIEKIKAAGVVGLGGATFPTHIKLSPPKGMKADVVIINGVECEPYLTIDNRGMIEKGHELMIGTKILMKALGVSKAIIGIENNKSEAIHYLTELCQSYSGITIQPLQVKYPQGGEKQLIKALINREVPSGALPIAVGAVVQNVGTTIAVYYAVQKNMPLIERAVTVTGKHVKDPKNLIVRIGTSFNELIENVGGIPENTGKIITGGPMTGKALLSTDIPVIKSTSGIIFFDDSEAHRKTYRDCIRCAKCVSVCPQGLEPFLLMNLVDRKNYERTEKEKVLDCIECGSCSYICPAYRPLLDFIRLGKTTVNKIIRERKQK
ncbi:MAG TPA: electron transport complex subunit RsxC, partial [Bacteroidales bacterium]|nr:electron transport complex subunit RsxC [Bacteroidales bacterium]